MPTYATQDFAQIAAIADGLRIAVCVVRAQDTVVLHANTMFYEILGSPTGTDSRAMSAALADALRMRDGTLYPRDRLPFARVLREKTSVTVDDIVLQREDGAKIFIRAFAQPLLDAFGAIDHVLATFTDITEEVEARARADLVEQRLQHVLSHAPLILFGFDRRGIVTLSEGRGLKLLGFRPKQLLGLSVYDLYANDPVSLANADRVLSGEEFSVESDLGSVVLETTFTPVRDADGTIEGAIGVSIDVTERKSVQKRLLQSERLASMGTLAAMVAHGINNPLTYVLGNLEIVARTLSDPGDPRTGTSHLVQWVNEAHEGADRVQRIVRDLQVFSRRDDDRVSPTDVHAVLRRALEITDTAIRHRARVVQDWATVPPVLANDLRLTQVFVNLLLNAAQAIPDGSADANEIRVFTRYDDEKKAVVVTLQDTGCGIAPEVKAHIFEPFFTTKAVSGGTGLGLSVCYGIVSGFGGRIEVECAEGEGATFRVHLPATERSTQDEAAAPIIGAQLRRGRLMVIDDDPNVARTFAFLLRPEHDVEVSSQPRAAAEQVLAGEPFDIIFCDLMMPEMTGMDFHALIAERLPRQAERIVFITGGAFTPAARAFVACNSNPVLQKPFDKNALDAVLASRLGR